MVLTLLVSHARLAEATQLLRDGIVVSFQALM